MTDEKNEGQNYRYLVFDSDACGYYLSSLEKDRWLVEYAENRNPGRKPALRFRAEEEDSVMKVIRETDDMFLSGTLVSPRILRNLSEMKRTPVCMLGRLCGSRLDRLVFETKRQGLCVSVARGSGSGDSIIMFLRTDAAKIRKMLLDLAAWECSSMGRRISACSRARTKVLGMTAVIVSRGMRTLTVLPEQKLIVTADRNGVTVTGYDGEVLHAVSADMTAQSGLTEMLKLLPEGCYCECFDDEKGKDVTALTWEA